MDMFEIAEVATLARQMNETIQDQTVREGRLGNHPHKFVWYNRSHEEFQQLTRGKKVGEARARGNWLFVPLEPGYVLLVGECGGKVLYHAPGSEVPQKYHLFIAFEDGSFLTVLTQMWGAMELYEQGKELERQYVKGMRPTPAEPEFTFEYFNALIDQKVAESKRSAKGLMATEQLVPGVGNSTLQDILFRARLHPRKNIATPSAEQRKALYEATVGTVREMIAKGGRYDETDLYGNPGGYVRLMDKNAVGRPCPGCGGLVEKIQYLGGACYVCPRCQEV
jgi:formamidopyrimidine-DNA glycosylase